MHAPARRCRWDICITTCPPEPWSRWVTWVIHRPDNPNPIQTRRRFVPFSMDSDLGLCNRLGNLLREPTPSPQIDPLPSSPRQRLHFHTFLLEPVLLPRHALALVAPRRDEAFGGDDALPWDVGCGREGFEGVSDVSTVWGQDHITDTNRYKRCGDASCGAVFGVVS